MHDMRKFIDYTATYTDLYELTMAQAYFLSGRKDEPAVFDYFFRKLPFDNGYAVFAGLEDLIEILENLHFDGQDLSFLNERGFDKRFLGYLERFRFRGNVFSFREGEVVFAGEPIIQVEAPIIESQIIETFLLNVLNFQTLIATKASRMRRAAAESTLVDFGLRRAQGPGGYYASRAAVIGGFDSTSNVRAGRDYGIPVSGTMAHSFVQSCNDELSAFRDFARMWPHNCVLLVDTYNTLKSGVPNAIRVAKEMEGRGERLKGIRLDSGDLAWLAKESRRMLDREGLQYVKIAASNKLDEFVIRSLKTQGAPVDLFGVGTSLVTGYPDGAVDGVYKLSFSGGKPRIKLTETMEKITLPDRKQVYRIKAASGEWAGADSIWLREESESERMYHPFEPLKSMSIAGLEKDPLLRLVMKDGRRTFPALDLKEIASYSKERLQELPLEYKRFENPHIYKVGISEGLKRERDRLINKFLQNGQTV